MICKYCGGEYADWAQKCPYCGNVNESADEKVYLKHLEEVRLRLDHVDEEADEAYHKNVGGSMGRLAKILILFLCIAILISGGYFLHTRMQDRRDEKKAIAQSRFEQEMYPQLDQWYEEGNYDRIISEFYKLIQEDSDYNFYSWSHYDYVFEFYLTNQEITSVRTDLKNGEQPYLSSALYDSLRLLYEMDDSYIEQLKQSYVLNHRYGLTEEEAEKIPPMRQNAYDFLFEDLKLNEEEITQFYNDNATDGYLTFRAVNTYAETLEKEIYHR